MRKSYSDKIFDKVNVFMMVILFVIFVFPIWFVLIASISDPTELHAGNVLLFPKGITLEGFQYIMKESALWRGYTISIFVTILGTILSMIMSICVAYPLSRKKFRLRNQLTVFYMFTMYFNGGLIPTYLLYKELRILNTVWALIIPSMLSVYNALIVRSYFQNSIPEELNEAAMLDGASEFQYLMRIVLPLSKPVFAVVGLYYAVSYWNNYTNALYYIQKEKLYPLQSVLRRLLLTSRMLAQVDDFGASGEALELMIKRVDVMKYGIIILAAIPMICIYPFIQKYFVKGTMIGAVKG